RAREKLSKERLILLEALEKSGGPAEITVDDRTAAIVLLRFRYPRASQKQDSLTEARAFLSKFQALIAPLIDPSELVPADTAPRNCTQFGASFARQVNSTRVLGGQLTVRFAADGSLSGIENSIASVPARVTPYSAASPAPGIPSSLPKSAYRAVLTP